VTYLAAEPGWWSDIVQEHFTGWNDALPLVTRLGLPDDCGPWPIQALELRALMKSEGLAPWPKLTGGKGVHLMAPLDKPMLHDRAHRIAPGICSEFAAREPDRFILSAQARRSGRIFLDYLRNGRGTTAIGTYSPRARQGFPIATPVSWARLEQGIRPDTFTIDSPFRVKRR
jgi:bifunctional non-homologous end joining protein LigD